MFQSQKWQLIQFLSAVLNVLTIALHDPGFADLIVWFLVFIPLHQTTCIKIYIVALYLCRGGFVLQSEGYRKKSRQF